MPALASEKPDWLVGASTLTGPVLMLILEHPSHAWDVGIRLRQRLGAAWNLDPADAHRVLERLRKRGLVVGRWEPNPKRPHKQIMIYYPTALTEDAVADWISSPVSREPDRGEILALFAVMPEERAPDLLLKLEEYAKDCTAASAKNDPEIPTESWMGLLMELARKAVIARLQAEIDWAEEARDWIEERLASKP
jgi:DNA-binding PadR family transcriptional regulator